MRHYKRVQISSGKCFEMQKKGKIIKRYGNMMSHDMRSTSDQSAQKMIVILRSVMTFSTSIVSEVKA